VCGPQRRLQTAPGSLELGLGSADSLEGFRDSGGLLSSANVSLPPAERRLRESTVAAAGETLDRETLDTLRSEASRLNFDVMKMATNRTGSFLASDQPPQPPRTGQERS
jgi:hypothetical protein